jgi:hypothetical protein
MGIPAHKRETTLVSARYLLDHCKYDPAEVRRVINRVLSDSPGEHDGIVLRRVG